MYRHANAFVGNKIVLLTIVTKLIIPRSYPAQIEYKPHVLPKILHYPLDLAPRQIVPHVDGSAGSLLAAGRLCYNPLKASVRSRTSAASLAEMLNSVVIC